MDTNPVKYLVCDGSMVIWLEDAEEGGFTVTSPFVPGLITEANTLAEAFVMARDAAEALEAGINPPSVGRTEPNG